ncbi:MAG TPA: polysaccharide biosynthesis protein [Pseudolysinimonas sp.]|nr:polysaccharide biosynthesis protein [Pseudolysinimonas sp.]
MTGASASASRLARRILAFAVVPFLSLLAPFLFLPVLARLAGADPWVAIALGQSVGGFAALVAGLGYPTLAPPRIAASDEARRRRILATSLHVRLPVWLVAAMAAGVVAAVLAPSSHRPEAAVMATGMSLAGLAPTWYWIGVGRALPILWFEVLPRMAATLVAAGILLAGGDVLWYPILLIVAMIAGHAVVYLREAGAELTRVDRSDAMMILRTHPPGVIAESAAGAYNALAVALVTGVSPVVEAAQYISGDKSYRIGQYSVSALGNALQGWVAETVDRAQLARRLRIAVALHAGVGALGFLTFALLGPLLTRVLFGSEVAIDELAAVGFGLATLGIAIGTGCGRIGLVTLDARTAFMVCVLVASAFGVVALLAGGAVWGATGAAWGLGITEVASGTVQGIVLLAVWRRGGVLAPDR